MSDEQKPTCPVCGKSLLVDGQYVRHEECIGYIIVPDDEAPEPEPADF